MLSDDLNKTQTQIGQALAKVYTLLIRLAEEIEKQTAHPDNFGEEAGKAEEQTPTDVETCDG